MLRPERRVGCVLAVPLHRTQEIERWLPQAGRLMELSAGPCDDALLRARLEADPYVRKVIADDLGVDVDEYHRLRTAPPREADPSPSEDSPPDGGVC
jgi:hypothetical protein